jgi:hypothetical protein
MWRLKIAVILFNKYYMMVNPGPYGQVDMTNKKYIENKRLEKNKK